MTFVPPQPFRNLGGTIVTIPSYAQGSFDETFDIVFPSVNIPVFDGTNFTAAVSVLITRQALASALDSCGALNAMGLPANAQDYVRNPTINRLVLSLDALTQNGVGSGPPTLVQFRVYALNAGGVRSITYDRCFTLNMASAPNGTPPEPTGQPDWTFADELAEMIGPMSTSGWEVFATIPSTATNAFATKMQFRLTVGRSDQLAGTSTYGACVTQDPPA